MQTATLPIETRLTVTAPAPAPAPVAVKQTTHNLTPKQAKILRELIDARERFNTAKRAMEAKQAELGLPRYEGQACTVTLVCAKRIVGEVQVSFRAGYTVDPAWVNKLVAK